MSRTADDDTEPCFLDQLIAERTKRDPDFPRKVDAAYQRRLAARRRRVLRSRRA